MHKAIIHTKIETITGKLIAFKSITVPNRDNEITEVSGELWIELRGHPLSMYAEFSEKLTFLTPSYALCVSGG